MLKAFPYFQKLTLKQQKAIEVKLLPFPPYSDFTFTSLYTYNTNRSVEISTLHGNLVVKFEDYLDRQPFYSFLGSHKVIDTADKLLNYSLQKHLPAVLKLIPQAVVEADQNLNRKYLIKQDLANHDYIVSTEEIVNLQGKKWQKKRAAIKKFKRLYPHYQIRRMDLSLIYFRKAIKTLFWHWQKQSQRTKNEAEIEFVALKRLFRLAKFLPIYATGLFIKDRLIAFTFYEKVHQGYAMALFEKASRHYADAYTVICHEGAKHALELGCQYLNFEQDLGIKGLRMAKSLWKPVHYLYKYTLQTR